ncbi:MAG: DUF3015 family protein [Pseudomonadota bacterium]
MKALVSMALAMGLVSGVAYADGHKGNGDSTGCGLGTTLWAGKTGLAPQVLAVTTNGTSGNQTFGITTGTLGCDQNDVIASAEIRMLASANLDNLAADIARGEGETLASLASAMEVDQPDQALMFATLKGNFARIFPNDSVTSNDVLVSIHEVMAEDEKLARYVEV